MKRVITLCLALVMVLGMLPGGVVLPVSAAEVSGYCGGEGDGTNLTWTLAVDGTLTIDGTGAMGDYTWSFLAPWHTYKDSIKAVTIGDSVTTISDYAFYDCDALSFVTIGNSVETIGDSAFYACDALSSVTIGNSVETIGNSAFYLCAILTSVTMGDGVKTIGFRAFYSTSISIVHYSGSRESWSKIEIDGLNEDLTSALVLCSDTVLSGVCGSGLEWTFDVEERILKIYGTGDMYDYDNSYATKRVPWIEIRHAVKSVEFSEYVSSIGNDAFSGMGSLETIYLPEGINKIGVSAFSGCEELKNITIPNSVMEIGESAFARCTELEKVVMGDGVTTLERAVFSGCETLSEIELPKYLEKINMYAFKYCYELETISIPDSVVEIGGYAFEDCSRLESVILPSKLTEIKTGTFEYCESLQSITIPEKVGVIGSNAFRGCSELRSIILPISLTDVYMDAFSRCSELVDVYYEGTAKQWENVDISSGNEELLYANLHTACDDANILEQYTFNGDGTHTMKKVCSDCSGIVYSSVQSCRDEIGEDNQCDYCRGTVICYHGKAVLVYVNNGDRTHTMTANCVFCGKKMAESVLNCEDNDADNLCNWCGAAIEHEGAEIEKFDVAGVNMTLGNELLMNFMVKTTDLGDGTYTAKITHNGNVTEQTFRRYNGTYHNVAYSVSAKQMADDITVEVFDEDGNAVSNVYTRSVRAYAMDTLAKDYSDETNTLLVDMLNYGAAAQEFFGYNEADLANGDLTREQKNMATKLQTCKDRRVKGKNYYGSNLSLEDRILFNVYFENVTSDMYAKITFTDFRGRKQKIDVDYDEFKKLKNNVYGVVVDDIVLGDSFCDVTVTVYKSNGKTHGTATDSVESYCARQNPDGEEQLYNTIMQFAAGAKAYLS